MARSPARAAPNRLPREELSPGSLWLGWGVYAAIALVGFCFGVWVGTQRPRVVEVAAAPTTKDETPKPAEKAPEKAPEKTPEKPAEKAAPKPPEKVVPKPPEKPAETPKKTEPPKPPEKPTDPPKKTEPPKDAPPATPVTFKEVSAVFRSSCITCHGTPSIKGGVDLRTAMSALKNKKGEPIVVPGDLKKSVLWTSIEDGSMPPAGEGKPLTDAEKKVVKDWILSGAK